LKYKSRKILLSIFGILIVLGGVFVLLSDVNPFKNTLVFEKNTDKDSAENALAKIVIKDSDNDGLRDWEEALWKTDPRNEDSDNDGTADGEEVRKGRDPAKPGPDDKIEPANKYKQVSGKEESNTVTGALINQILTYTSAQQSGNLNIKTKEELDVFLAEEIKKDTRINAPSKYSIDDLVIVKINNTEKFIEYKDSMESIIKRYSGLYPETEFDIVATAVENNDEAILNKLDPYINTYKQLIKDLLTTVTPSDIALFHLEIVNGYERLINSIINMKNGAEDPIRNLIGIAGYQESATKITDAYVELFNEINNKLNPE